MFDEYFWFNPILWGLIAIVLAIAFVIYTNKRLSFIFSHICSRYSLSKSGSIWAGTIKGTGMLSNHEIVVRMEQVVEKTEISFGRKRKVINVHLILSLTPKDRQTEKPQEIVLFDRLRNKESPAKEIERIDTLFDELDKKYSNVE